MSGKYPNTFYRVSLKALLFNDQGEILVVKEKNNIWDMPGGGIDHGETPHQALARELYEEVLLQTPFTERLVEMSSGYLPDKEAWLMRLVYIVDAPGITAQKGADASEVAFIHPAEFKDSPLAPEKRLYDLAQRYHTY